MLRTALCIAAFSALFSATLQPDPPVAPRRVAGLVEIPRLFGEPAQHQRQRVGVMLFHEPSDRSSTAVTIRGRENLELREHGYEEVSAVVYGRRAGWFLLRAGRRHAWLAPRDAGRFRPYPQLLVNRLTYLTQDWDRALYHRPGGAIAAHVAAIEDPSTGDPAWAFGNKATQPSDVAVVEVREHAGRWWAHVRVQRSICTSDEYPPPVTAQGWLPVYGQNGNPTLWFHSRGC